MEEVTPLCAVCCLLRRGIAVRGCVRYPPTRWPIHFCRAEERLVRGLWSRRIPVGLSAPPYMLSDSGAAMSWLAGHPPMCWPVFDHFSPYTLAGFRPPPYTLSDSYLQSRHSAQCTPLYHVRFPRRGTVIRSVLISRTIGRRGQREY
jgi:hypothetical protein